MNARRSRLRSLVTAVSPGGNALGAALCLAVLGGCCVSPCDPCRTTWCCAPSPCAPAWGATWTPAPGGTGAAAPSATPSATPVATAPPSAPPKGSGFLSDYSGMAPGRRLQSAWVWMKPGMDLRRYDDLLIDEITVMAAPGSKVEDLPEEIRSRCSNAFQGILEETLDPYYSVRHEPGPHTLRVRIALTDLVPATAESDGSPSVETGSAALEVEILDSMTGEALLRGMDRRKGSKSGTKARAEWRAAEGAFRDWANALLQFLDEHTKGRS